MSAPDVGLAFRRPYVSRGLKAEKTDDQLQVIRRGIDLLDGIRHAGLRAGCGAWRLCVLSGPFRGLSPACGRDDRSARTG